MGVHEDTRRVGRSTTPATITSRTSIACISLWSAPGTTGARDERASRVILATRERIGSARLTPQSAASCEIRP